MVLSWTAEDGDYIRSRSRRYRGAIDLEPEWTQEVLADDDLVELRPYPASRVGASGFIGWSSSAGRVLVVIAYRDLAGALHGMNAWPASGRDLTLYRAGQQSGNEPGEREPGGNGPADRVDHEIIGAATPGTISSAATDGSGEQEDQQGGDSR